MRQIGIGTLAANLFLWLNLILIRGISPKLMDRSAKYLKSLVGAPGFEPGASCAQGRRSRGAAYIIYEHERIGAVLDQSEIRQNEHRGTRPG